MATIDTRIKQIDPLSYDVFKYVIENNSVNVMQVQLKFNLSLERASAIVDYGVDKGYLIQNNYLSYSANMTLEQLNEEFDKN